jgi:sec-independent protein translocase protein TatA
MIPLALLNLGPWEIALILVLALLLFGGKKLPSLAKDLGSGIKEFRKSLSSAGEEETVSPPTEQVPSAPIETPKVVVEKTEESPRSKKKA